MTVKHTAGPWIASTIVGREPEVLMVGGGDDGSLIVADVRFDYGLDTVRANANLIAAAPDLLAALQELLEHEPEEMVGVWYNARTAVAKATGKDT